MIQTVKRVFEIDTGNQITNAAAKTIKDNFETLEAVDTSIMDDATLTQHNTDLAEAQATFENLEQQKILTGTNAKFWKKTPGARMEFYIDDPDMLATLKVGDRFENNITKVT